MNLEWVGQITDMAKTLVVIGIVVGILFDDYFGVIAGLGRIMSQFGDAGFAGILSLACLLYTSPSPRDKRQSRMPSSA